MSILSGPLGTHKGYIAYIALPNCADYFDLCELQREKGNYQPTSSKYERLRLFLNAAESLNNIPEYIFHEYKSAYSWNHEAEVRNLLSRESKIHETINTLANGYKHCVRNPPRKAGQTKEIDAGDFQEIKIIVSAQLSTPLNLDVSYSFESLEDEEMLAEAFRFWVEYHNHQDLSKLLGVSE
ncbi:hypothetical protein [Stutzerimonas nitrititolerans]|uniref:hypothetical protein n=1 Tax=Stutzerimonas nitrititolerans TaxID=2482751 RepID=UPI0028B18908|nr:hypothetical protein [Stutzerimonas nitrititolerans]